MDSSATPPAEIICLNASVGNRGWASKQQVCRKGEGQGYHIPGRLHIRTDIKFLME